MCYLGLFVIITRESIHMSSSQEGKILLGLRLSHRVQEQAKSWTSRVHWSLGMRVPGTSLTFFCLHISASLLYMLLMMDWLPLLFSCYWVWCAISQTPRDSKDSHFSSLSPALPLIHRFLNSKIRNCWVIFNHTTMAMGMWVWGLRWRKSWADEMSV